MNKYTLLRIAEHIVFVKLTLLLSFFVSTSNSFSEITLRRTVSTDDIIWCRLREEVYTG